eukprot:1629227-Lingulodinium_polyedra.AAC.1
MDRGRVADASPAETGCGWIGADGSGSRCHCRARRRCRLPRCQRHHRHHPRHRRLRRPCHCCHRCRRPP